MEDDKPKRRVRYKGSHPKEFKEKYKEQQPDKYAADIEKVIAKGRTPAGMHLSICVNEIMEILNIQPGEVGMDATLGYGGHSAEMLKRLQPGGRLYATDVDPFELPKTKERLTALGYGPETLFIRKMNFAGIDRIVHESGPLNFVLADLGLSSMQIDNPERGFSHKVEGPLDLRLNPVSGKSAAEYLQTVTQEDLEDVLLANADETYFEEIASALIKNRYRNITTTTLFIHIITETLERLNLTKDEIKKSITRCFQALRIEVNDEFGVLEQFLEKLPDALAPGGRVAIMSFHSGEDRRVKKAFQYFYREGLFSSIAPDPIRASTEECFNNRRAKSAKLRWAVKR
jgi:16S rRNA (cytosine1402-N4)-methyltransferase